MNTSLNLSTSTNANTTVNEQVLNNSQERCCQVCKTPLSLSFGLASAGGFVLDCNEKLHDPNSPVRIRETCFKCSMKLVKWD